MAGFSLFEPEESVGWWWHRRVGALDEPPLFDDAKVTLDSIRDRIAVVFRAFGGSGSVAMKTAANTVASHRLSWRRRLGRAADTVVRASFDGATVYLPESVAVLPSREANEYVYVCLAAFAAHASPAAAKSDPLQADFATLIALHGMTAAVADAAPGLAQRYRTLCAQYRELRPSRPRLPTIEAALERTIRWMLGGTRPTDPLARQYAHCVEQASIPDTLRAPGNYCRFLAVPLWLEVEIPESTPASAKADTIAGKPPAAGSSRQRRARRQRSDEADRHDSLILYPFQALLSWAEFLNLNRHVDDDDQDNAAKAADDIDEIALGQVAKTPSSRIVLDLDLAPEDVEAEALSGVYVYPEWDCRNATYLPAAARVLHSRVDPSPDAPPQCTPGAARRIRAVRRQFEALRPARRWSDGEIDGDELDTNAVIRAHVERLAVGHCDDRVWRQRPPQVRDLAVSILLDISRSTEAAVGGRTVLDIEREALIAMAWGLDDCGDDSAIHAFSSLRRDRVFLFECKTFGERMSAAAQARIAALRPGFYTRLGAPIRHLSAQLSEQARKRRLLLVITDGKPNDLDHYEGRYGVEDTRAAVREARRAGHAVFGVTVDSETRDWFPRIFGAGGFALLPDAASLMRALPAIYRQLVGG